MSSRRRVAHAPELQFASRRHFRMARQDLLGQGGARTGHPDDKDWRRVLDPEIGLAIAVAGRRRFDQPVDASDEPTRLRPAGRGAKTVARLEVSHRRFIISHVVMRLPQREDGATGDCGASVRSRQSGVHPRDQRAVVGGELPVGRDAGPGAAHVRGKLGGAQMMRRGLRRKTGLTEELGQDAWASASSGCASTRGAHRGESLVEGARGLQGARLGDPSHHRPRSSRRRGAEGAAASAFGTASDRARQAAFGADEIRLQRDRRLIARHRLALLAQAVEDVAEIMCALARPGSRRRAAANASIACSSWPPRYQGDAEVMV